MECLESSASDRRPLPKYPDGREDALEQELHNLESKTNLDLLSKPRNKEPRMKSI